VAAFDATTVKAAAEALLTVTLWGWERMTGVCAFA
jgi:hypothetical protein